MKKRGILICFLAFFTAVCLRNLKADAVISNEIKAAILGENWVRVTELSLNNKELETSPVLRAINGHACLMLNKNNLSLSLFLSLDSLKERQEWLNWASDFASEHPGASVALYLKGDASARIGDWEGALISLNQALNIESKMILALNARGVAYATKGEIDKAMADFDTAISIDSNFAEAYASKGATFLMRMAEKGADSSYSKALKIEPDFALALNGLACAKYGSNRWNEANNYFAQAARTLPLPVFIGNLRAVAVAAENLSNPGQDSSALFRFSDFLDWNLLRDSTLRDGDILRIMIGGPLPETLDGMIIDKLNLALSKAGFYNQIKDRLDFSKASDKLRALIAQAGSTHPNLPGVSGAQSDSSTELLNRLILELSYPTLIAQCANRDPGMNLVWKDMRLSMQDKISYYRDLPIDRFVMGQARVQNAYLPLANLLKSSPIPVIKFFGAEWEQHLTNCREIGNIVAGEKRINIQSINAGGVSAELKRGFIDNGNWPVVSWFGLAQ